MMPFPGSGENPNLDNGVIAWVYSQNANLRYDDLKLDFQEYKKGCRFKRPTFKVSHKKMRLFQTTTPNLGSKKDVG
jgi:hypothetical protein